MGIDHNGISLAFIEAVKGRTIYIYNFFFFFFFFFFFCCRCSEYISESINKISMHCVLDRTDIFQMQWNNDITRTTFTHTQ